MLGKKFDKQRPAGYTAPNWSRFLSVPERARRYNKAETTIRNNIRTGAFVVGQDCYRYGNTWLLDSYALDFLYSSELDKK